jgi:hypothetical protein
VLRLAFVGQRAFFHYCSLQEEAEGIEPRFFEHLHAEDPEPLCRELTEWGADVVWVWRPEVIDPGGFANLDALTIGYATEPLPRPGRRSHPDLDERLEHLHLADPDNFDRIISFDPIIVPTIQGHMPVWRSLPIPVADSYYRPVTRMARRRPRVLFTGRSTPRRQEWLDPVKHRFDVLHIEHGMTDAELIEQFDRVDLGLNLHNHPYPTYENRVSAYLAAGLLVASEPLSPNHGLVPGTDFIEVRTPYDIPRTLEELEVTPEAFYEVRVSGRMQAERFRASRVYPRVVADLMADVAAFGGRRRST